MKKHVLIKMEIMRERESWHLLGIKEKQHLGGTPKDLAGKNEVQSSKTSEIMGTE